MACMDFKELSIDLAHAQRDPYASRCPRRASHVVSGTRKGRRSLQHPFIALRNNLRVQVAKDEREDFAWEDSQRRPLVRVNGALCDDRDSGT